MRSFFEMDCFKSLLHSYTHPWKVQQNSSDGFVCVTANSSLDDFRAHSMRFGPRSLLSVAIMLVYLQWTADAQPAGSLVCKQCMTGTSGKCQASDGSCWPLTSADTCPPLTSVCVCPVCADHSAGTCYHANGTCETRHPAGSCPPGTWECSSAVMKGSSGGIIFASTAPTADTASSVRDGSAGRSQTRSVAIVAGAVIGSLFGIALLGICVYYVHLCKRRAQVEPGPKSDGASDEKVSWKQAGSLAHGASSVSLSSMANTETITGKGQDRWDVRILLFLSRFEM
jgi:hypothetical protein